MDFVVSLNRIIDSGISDDLLDKIDEFQRDLQQWPFFELLPQDSQGAPEIIEIKIDDGETKKQFELGEVIYLGDPADSIKVKILELAGEEQFAKIVKFGDHSGSSDQYVLAVDLNFGQPDQAITYESGV